MRSILPKGDNGVLAGIAVVGVIGLSFLVRIWGTETLPLETRIGLTLIIGTLFSAYIWLSRNYLKKLNAGKHSIEGERIGVRGRFARILMMILCSSVYMYITTKVLLCDLRRGILSPTIIGIKSAIFLILFIGLIRSFISGMKER